MLTSLFLQISCDNGKSTSESDDDVISNDQTVLDESADEKNDAGSDSPTDIDSNMPDEDVAPSITIKCPETIDEDSGKVLCEIFSKNNSAVLASGDTCGGQIENETTYSFTPGESFGPGTCIAKIRDTVNNEVAQAEITINEVNAPPKFTSSDFDGFNFGETYLSNRTFYFTDDDNPQELETDPGFASCSVRDNTCGIELDILNENYSCTVSGTMLEELNSGNCNFKLVLTDGYGEETVETVTSSLIEKNEIPVWTEEPSAIEVIANKIFSKTNGKASDTDLPNLNEGNPGYLSCELDSDSCSFDVSVSSLRDTAGTVSCKIDLTSGDMETCDFQYHVTDGVKSIYSGNIIIKVDSTVTLDCPETIDEEVELICDITPNGGTPSIASGLDNCYGSVVNEGGSWKYKKTFNEFESPTSCTAAVIAGESTAEDSVNVLEVNNAPVLTFGGTCETPETTAATEGTDFYCYANFSDVDRPNILTTDPGFMSCEIKNNTCGSWLTFDVNCNGTGQPDEETGNTECSYLVEILDGYGEIVSETVTITIAEHNNYPEFTQSPATQYHLIVGEHLEFTYSGTDSDLPDSSEGDPGYLKCGVLNEEAQSTITSTGVGSGAVTCNVEIDANFEEECASSCPVTFEIEDGSGIKETYSAYIYVRKCIFFVKPDGTGTRGRDWGDAFGTIQEAVDEAWSGCEIWVKQGTYTNSLHDRSPVITMKNSIKIIGGFEGDEVYDDQEENNRYRPGDPIVHSVLDGEDYSYHVVVGNLNHASLDGFIITGGNADGDTDDQKVGGGMYNYGTENSFSEPFVKHCIFTENYAENFGGAVYNEGFSSPRTEFYRCFFYENSSGEFGGAIFSKNASNLEYKECEFLKNISNNGGAITEYHSASIVDKCVFKENVALASSGFGGTGGALKLTSNSAVMIDNSIFLKNNAETSGGAINGGADDEIIVDHATFSKNTSSVSGCEAIYGMKGEIKNSIFWDNGIDSTDLVIIYSYGTGDSGEGNINSIPSGSGMFINEDTDLHLDPTSPAIDSGHPSPHLYDDVEGTERPLGDFSDMGAYEHESVQADYYVDCEVTSTGDGSSWASPLKTFHQAIAQINLLEKTGTIFVKGGNCTYSEVGASQDNIVSLSDDIKIYGGFAGTEKYLRERIDPSATPTILDGEKNTITIIAVEGGNNVVIDGFVIRNGYAGGFSGPILTGSKVANCIFEDNKAQYGGAMHISGSLYNTLDPSVIVNSSFINNQGTSSTGGGAIYFNHINSTNIAISNCDFVNNSIYNGDGSAIYSQVGAHFIIKNSVFFNNVSRTNSATQIMQEDSSNVLNSVTETNPLFVNAPQFFAIAFDPGTTTRIDFHSTISGLTTAYLVEIDNDGVLREITSIGGASVFFANDTLSYTTQTGTTAQFWPSGTTSADLDIHLTDSSPCIDNGTFVKESIRDYSGKERDKDAFDIGIYEY